MDEVIKKVGKREREQEKKEKDGMEKRRKNLSILASTQRHNVSSEEKSLVHLAIVYNVNVLPPG